MNAPCKTCTEHTTGRCSGMCKDFQKYAGELKNAKKSRLEFIYWNEKKPRFSKKR